MVCQLGLLIHILFYRKEHIVSMFFYSGENKTLISITSEEFHDAIENHWIRLVY